jgi:hypothetical protein
MQAFDLAAHIHQRKHRDRGPRGVTLASLNALAPLRRIFNLRIVPLEHSADETNALARQRADQLLRLAAISDRRACRIDTCSQGRFRDNAPAPNRGDQIVLADDPVAVTDQVFQEVEHLRLYRDGSTVAAQLALINVEDKIIK